MPEDIVLFVQRRCGKSGAPVALSGLLGHAALRSLHPVLLASAEGWLTEQCCRMQVPFLNVLFPSSRSLGARLWGNRRFALRVRHVLNTRDFRPRLVVGNDHLEGLLALAISRDWKARRALFLRSSEMTERDYFKYRCDRFERVYAAGEALQAAAARWDPSRDVRLLRDGVNAEEILPPKPRPAYFPNRVLVVGSESHFKGWQDLVAAVDLLEKDPAFPALDIDFTGQAPNRRFNDMQLDKPRRCRFHFLGRVEQFRELVRQYDLVIHPSRQEAFGLAMVEILAAGVALLCSRAGIIKQIQAQPAMLFDPRCPQDLARKIQQLREHWTETDFGLDACQRNIRDHFLLDRTAPHLAEDLRRLIMPG